MSTRTDSAGHDPVIESREQLIAAFAKGEKPKDRWRIGTEHEKFVYDRGDHHAPSYEEKGGIHALLDFKNRKPLESNRAIVPKPELLPALLGEDKTRDPIELKGIVLAFGGVRAIDGLSAAEVVDILGLEYLEGEGIWFRLLWRTDHGNAIYALVTPEAFSALHVLREDLDVTSPKASCQQGGCGACTVLINGEAVRSCIRPVSQVQNVAITTLEGLQDNRVMQALMRAFEHEQAIQCGYCVSGILITAQTLLDTQPTPTEHDVLVALDGHLCRCGTHWRFVRAILRATTSLEQAAA